MNPLAQGFWLGLATGPYCFMACAPFLVPYLCAEGAPGLTDNLKTLARFLAGRFLAYLIFGAAAGALGAAVDSSVPTWLPAAALAMSALLMFLCAAVHGFPRISWCLAAGRWATPQRMPLAMGFLTGINVCPPFLTGMVVVLAMGRAAAGAAFFTAFFAATSLYLLPVLGVWPWLSSARARSVGRWVLLLAGAWYLIAAARLPWR
jgi:sulfite exporter TauE/SafE